MKETDPAAPPPEPDPPDAPVSMDVTDPIAVRTKRRCDGVDPKAKKLITSPVLASASIQTVFTHPSYVVGAIQNYSDNDKGPFLVHVALTTPDLASGTSLRAIKFGQFLATNKIPNVCRDGIKKIGRNKLSVEFLSAKDANTFLINPLLPLHSYSASIPTYNVTRMGLVRQVPTDLSMEQFVKDIVVPQGSGIVVKARRLSRKENKDGEISWIPTQTVVVTFLGQILPERVYLYYTSLPIELYKYPTIQCYSCCRFGHTKAQCRSKPRCFRCAQEHFGDSCVVQETSATCLHCLGQHFSINKKCPEQERQRSIKSVMAEQCVSYQEAAAQFPPVVRSYSEVAQILFSHPSPSNVSSVPRPTNPSQTPHSHSYTKTVYATPRPKPVLGKSYDRAAHSKIVSTPKSTMLNGSALSNVQSPLSNNNMLESLLSFFIDMVLSNPQKLPSHVASKLNQLASLVVPNGPSPTPAVEQSQHQN